MKKFLVRLMVRLRVAFKRIGSIFRSKKPKEKLPSQDAKAPNDTANEEFTLQDLGGIDAILDMDFDDTDRFDREQYRECLIQIESIEELKDTSFELQGDDEKMHYIRMRRETTLLEVNQPGEYMCIYEYTCRRNKPIKGKMLCIVGVARYQCFHKIKDLYKRSKSIRHYSLCSSGQKKYIDEIMQRKAFSGDENHDSETRGTRRDIVTDPYALEMMFQLCKHTLPANIRFQCEELIEKRGRGIGSGESMILADILNTCCENGPKQPFLSTKECLEVFRKRRYGDDPWVKDIIRQIRLLDRCDNSGAVFVLVGPPGTGKTQIAEAIAECTNKKFCVVNCRNKNGLEMGGCHRTYTDSRHGEIQENLLYYGSDCCMLLDEFEKMVITEKEGNPFNLFVSTWDDRKTFTDAFTGIPVPTKNVIWVLTVNSVDKVPDYILNRFQENVFVLDSYNAQTKVEISKRFIVPKYMKTYNFTEQEVRFTEEGLVAIARTTYDAGARITAQKIEKVLRAVNEKLEEGHEMPIVIDSSFAMMALNDTAQTMGEKRHTIGF